MVIKREAGDAAIELGLVVIPVFFRAQIVDPVVIPVLLVQELLDGLVVVAVHGLHALGGVAHGDDFVVDVGEVQVELALLVPAFLLADDGLDGRRHHVPLLVHTIEIHATQPCWPRTAAAGNLIITGEVGH